MKSSQTSLQKSSGLTRKDGCYNLSIYKGELTTQFVINTTVKLKSAFPSLPMEFYKIFSDRIKENGFNDNRLNDAVNHVIDNCIYPTPTIAQFISFDRSVKLYNYDDMVKLNNENAGAFERYNTVHVRNSTKPLWASIQDIEKFNLEPFKKK